MITWSFVEPLQDELSLEEFEADYGIALPEAYKALARKSNGGYPSHDTFALPSGEKVCMNHMYSLCAQV